MIDLQKLSSYKEAFGFFAQQLTYPTKRSVHLVNLEGQFDPAIVKLISTYGQKLQKLSLADIEETYVQTFDFQKKSTLYMTYAKFEDGKDRGEMLAMLKATYELHGLEIADGELSDYLPLMCEFLYAAAWEQHKYTEESIRTLVAVIEDGTYGLMQALEKYNSPYYDLIKALREIFKLCLRREVQEHA